VRAQVSVYSTVDGPDRYIRVGCPLGDVFLVFEEFFFFFARNAIFGGNSV
jgi:hypothetical protein